MKQIPKLIVTFIALLSLLVSARSTNEKHLFAEAANDDKKEIIALADSFNSAAAQADYNTCFNFYTNDAIFAGTEATERWNKQEFVVWAKTYFEKRHAWDFKSLTRNICFGETGSLAWFDELLNTQIKICRGSGVLVKQAGVWKKQQYIYINHQL